MLKTLLLVLCSDECALQNRFSLKVQNILHRWIKGKLLIWHDDDLLKTIVKTIGNDEMLVIATWEDEIWKSVEQHSFGKRFHPTSPLLLVLHLSAIRISIREPIVKVLDRIHRKTSHRDASPSQCLPTPTGPPLLQNGQITTIILWECSVRGMEKLMVRAVKSQTPAEKFHQHWGHCTDESHLEQEVLSKSMQQRNRLDLDIGNSWWWWSFNCAVCIFEWWHFSQLITFDDMMMKQFLCFMLHKKG